MCVHSFSAPTFKKLTFIWWHFYHAVIENVQAKTWRETRRTDLAIIIDTNTASRTASFGAAMTRWCNGEEDSICFNRLRLIFIVYTIAMVTREINEHSTNLKYQTRANQQWVICACVLFILTVRPDARRDSKTASVLKHDPNTWKVQNNAIY